MSLGRIAPLSGLVFVVLTVVGLVGLSGNTPDIKSSQAKIAAYYVKHHANQETSVHIIAIAVLFLVIFAASCWSLLQGAGPVWPAVFYGGALVMAAGWTAAGIIHLALADGAHHGVSPGALQALNALDADSYIGFSVGMGTMLVGAGGAMIKRPGIGWLGWLALVLGVLSFTPIGFVAFLGGGIWIIAASILLYVRSGSAGAETAPATAR